MKNKGQIAIFVIIAIMLVAGLALFFFARGNQGIISVGGIEFNPARYMDQCIQDAVVEVSDAMIEQGGVYEPQDYKLYEGVKATYLCKNINYYQPCINQQPQYVSFVEKQIRDEIKDDISLCLDSLREELENRNYEVSYSAFNVSIEIKQGSVSVSLPLELVLRKGDVSQRFDTLSSVTRTPIYDLALVAHEIVSQEAKYCYFEYVGFNLLYSDFITSVNKLSDDTKVYSVEHVPTKKIMRFAVRGCAFPAGL